MQLQHADDAGRGLEVDRMAALEVGRAPRRRRVPEPKEQQHWWRTRRGRSYRQHTAEALVEDQSRCSGGTSEDWGWRNRSLDSDGLDLFYAGRYNMQGSITRLP